jgi:hypothetical protein
MSATLVTRPSQPQHMDGGARDGPVAGGGGAALLAHLEVGAAAGVAGFLISGGPSSPSGAIMDGAPMHLAAHHHHADLIGPTDLCCLLPLTAVFRSVL